MSAWTKEEEAAFRGAPHRWTYNERLMLEEIEELRAKLKAEETARANFFLQYGPQINEVLTDD